MRLGQSWPVSGFAVLCCASSYFYLTLRLFPLKRCALPTATYFELFAAAAADPLPHTPHTPSLATHSLPLAAKVGQPVSQLFARPLIFFYFSLLFCCVLMFFWGVWKSLATWSCSWLKAQLALLWDTRVSHTRWQIVSIAPLLTGEPVRPGQHKSAPAPTGLFVYMAKLKTLACLH